MLVFCLSCEWGLICLFPFKSFLNLFNENGLPFKAQLRYELQTNKPLTPITDGRDDEKVWNSYLESETAQEGEIPKWWER